MKKFKRYAGKLKEAVIQSVQLRSVEPFMAFVRENKELYDQRTIIELESSTEYVKVATIRSICEARTDIAEEVKEEAIAWAEEVKNEARERH